MLEYKSEKSKRRDLNLFYELYNFRVLTIEQFSRRFGYTKGSLYHFLAGLLKSGLIQSHGIKGYKKVTGKLGKYYTITNRGIRFLDENGYVVTHSADALRISDMRVMYELVVNDLYYELKESGWELHDSRATKKKMGLNRGDNLHGSLSSPVLNEYPFYLFLNNDNISDLWLNRVIREINKYNFMNIVLLTDGEYTFSRVFQVMSSKAESFTYKNFMMMSL